MQPAIFREAGQEYLTSTGSAANVCAVQPPTEAGVPAAARPASEAAIKVPSRRRLDLASLANHLVTVLLVVAVGAVLAVNVGPLVFPYRVYTVLSGSMQPAIPVGSEVVAVAVPASQIRVGDIITFQRPGHAGELVTHRIVDTERSPRTGQLYWITRGDANGVPDQWRIPAQGTGLEYAFHVPLIGYALVALSSPLGRVTFILAPALLLAAVVLNDLWKTPVGKPEAGAES